MGERVKYSKEFKLEAIRLAREPDQSVPKVACDLGISDSSLHGWIRQENEAGERAFPGKGKQNCSKIRANQTRCCGVTESMFYRGNPKADWKRGHGT